MYRREVAVPAQSTRAAREVSLTESDHPEPAACPWEIIEGAAELVERERQRQCRARALLLDGARRASAGLEWVLLAVLIGLGAFVVAG